MSINIALAGNPNCGKTTLFNDLTGSSQYVGNWPGVTVEKKEGRLKKHKDVIITDLPGIYSLSPYTLEEVISRKFLLEEHPDVILNLVDATNLERNLYLTTQLLELGIPMVVALNMSDLLEKNGIQIDAKKLEKQLGCPVIAISALKGTNSLDAAKLAISVAGKEQSLPYHFDRQVEDAISAVQAACPEADNRWVAVKLLERDEQMVEQLKPAETVEKISADLEEKMDDDTESIITDQRYTLIAGIVGGCMVKKAAAMSTSDKIDRVVTNRWAALPIFAAIMFIVYYISVSWIGTIATDWANDGVFGDGWFLGFGQDAYNEAVETYDEEYAAAVEELAVSMDVDAEAFSEDLDAALEESAEAEDPLGAALASLEVDTESAQAQTLMSLEEPVVDDYGLWVPGIPVLIEDGLNAVGAADWLQSLILDGIVAGVGAVLGFVPQMIILFLLLSILEDCGYMARVAFIMDKIFRRFGLSGKSFIPMLIASGCGVPGVMASKTIENEKDRRMTVMTTTFIPCSAKLPVIALIAGAFFPDAWWMTPIMYFIGIALVIISGIILKKTKAFAGDPAPFVMELPQYHFPAVKGVLLHMWERVKSFIIKAGTIIFVSSALIWFLSSFGFTDSGFGMVEINDSMLAAIGNFIAPIFIPLGFGTWEAVAGTISGLIAKENVVSTLGVLLNVGADAAEDDPSLLLAFTSMLSNSVAAFSFLTFNLYCIPCFAAVGTIRREMNNGKWFAFALIYQVLLAYVLSLMIYQIVGLFAGVVGFSVWTVVAFLLLIGVLYLLFRPAKKHTLSRAAERA